MQTRNKCWTHGCIVPGVVHTKLDPIRVRLNKDTLDSKKSNKQSLLSVTSPASSFYPPKMYSNTNIFKSLLLIIFFDKKKKKISLIFSSIIFLYKIISHNLTESNCPTQCLILSTWSLVGIPPNINGCCCCFCFFFTNWDKE